MPLFIPQSSLPTGLTNVNGITPVSGSDFIISNTLGNTSFQVNTSSDNATIISGALFSSGNARLNGVIIPSGTTGLQIYNNLDPANAERLDMFFATNVANIKTSTVGGGTSRNLSVQAGVGSFITLRPAASNLGAIQFGLPTPNALTTTIGVIIAGTSTATGGVNSFVSLNPTYNGAGTGVITDLLINRTQTLIGSGNQSFSDFQIGGVSRLRISNSGDVYSSGAFSTGPVTGNLLPSTWKLGPVRTGTALTASTTIGLQVFIDGTLYTIPVLSSNP